jgi:hypothetical protein
MVKILFSITDWGSELLRKLSQNVINAMHPVILILIARTKAVIYYLYNVATAGKKCRVAVVMHAEKPCICL